MTLSASEPVSRTALLNGHKVHYLSTGKGDEALVFIHGWTCDATFWKGQAPVYEKRRSLLIDLPGHGLSDKPEVSYTMDLFAQAVHAVMAQERVTKATIIGHSMGGPVAVQYMRVYPDQTSALVLVDATLPMPPKNEAERRKQLVQAAATAKALRAPDYKAFDKYVINFMFAPHTSPALRSEILDKMLAAPQYVMASAMDGMNSMKDVTERYPDMPVEAIMQKRPSLNGFEDFLKQHFHLVDYQEWSDTGHFLMMEHPERFNQALVEFLERK